MGILKIVKRPDSTKYQTGKCPRCYGCLAGEWESELEANIQRCVLCGYRHELKAQNHIPHDSLLRNVTELNF